MKGPENLSINAIKYNSLTYHNQYTEYLFFREIIQALRWYICKGIV